MWNNRILRAAFWASIDRELRRIAFILGCSPQSFHPGAHDQAFGAQRTRSWVPVTPRDFRVTGPSQDQHPTVVGHDFTIIRPTEFRARANEGPALLVGLDLHFDKGRSCRASASSRCPSLPAPIT